MWRRFPHDGFVPPLMARGAVKFIILDLLREKPKHGYEIMKEMEAKACGLHTPSPGSVYPTLQMLEEMGYVVSRQDANKRVYEITAEGRKYLAENRAALEELPDPTKFPFAAISSAEAREAAREMHYLVGALLRAIRANRLQRPEQFKQVRDILARAREEIGQLLEQ
ncbi:MAG: PadR family transcriptional regulator [Dehalococcoidia bacterium]|nr:PadR family transcriptional regulator [Dehalococcoidia bacterium]